MGQLKNKSELNLSAAELLHKQSYYPSVVHCAYYSCVQLMKHTWLTSMGKTNNDLKALNTNSKDGSHEILINQIKAFVKSKSQDDRVFYRDILILKRLRVNSDYDDILIDYSISGESIRLSKLTQKILKKSI
jgi:uncharacterized protein (UPF0332 family)